MAAEATVAFHKTVAVFHQPSVEPATEVEQQTRLVRIIDEVDQFVRIGGEVVEFVAIAGVEDVFEMLIPQGALRGEQVVDAGAFCDDGVAPRHVRLVLDQGAQRAAVELGRRSRQPGIVEKVE